MFLVSHDRRFLDNVVTSTLVSEGDGRWREYVGDVQDWLTQSARAEALQRDRTPAATTSGPPATPAPAKTPSVTAKPKLSYKEQREFDALPARIAALETEQGDIDRALADGQLFATDPARAAQLGARHADIETEWLQALERWEALGGS
ncbi:ABC transporter ATP-binding protein uup [compost metagenome]